MKADNKMILKPNTRAEERKMEWELTSVSHGSQMTRIAHMMTRMAHMTTRMTRWLAGSLFVKTRYIEAENHRSSCGSDLIIALIDRSPSDG